MRNLITTTLLLSALSVNAQTMSPHNGPICPDPGPVYTKATPKCGATTIDKGLFKQGRFMDIYESTETGCILREYFLGCV